MIIVTEYKGQNSILLFPIRVSGKHLILYAQVFYLLHTGGAPSPPWLLTISREIKVHDMEIVGSVISMSESQMPSLDRSRRITEQQVVGPSK